MVAPELGCKEWGDGSVRFSGSLCEEPAQFGVFVHCVPGMFHEPLPPYRIRAVLVMLFGGFGRGGRAGFLLGLHLSWPGAWYFGCSVHGAESHPLLASNGRELLGYSTVLAYDAASVIRDVIALTGISLFEYRSTAIVVSSKTMAPGRLSSPSSQKITGVGNSCSSI